MAGSVNKVILIGNLGQDPEVRSFQNGGKVVNLRIAPRSSGRTATRASGASGPSGTRWRSFRNRWAGSPSSI